MALRGPRVGNFLFQRKLLHESLNTTQVMRHLNSAAHPSAGSAVHRVGKCISPDDSGLVDWRCVCLPGHCRQGYFPPFQFWN